MPPEDDQPGKLKAASAALNERLNRLTGGRFSGWRAAFLASPIIGSALIFSVLASIYWLLIASDRYVSEARVIVQRTDLVANVATDLTAILTGQTTNNRQDQLVMRDYLMSRDNVIKLDNELGLRDHYSAWNIDPFSRLNFGSSAENLQSYYNSRVSVEFDEYAGVLVIRAQAFNPQKAEEISSWLVSEGERFMNAAEHRLAADQVAFLETQVTELNQRATAARQAVIDYQNQEGIVSPTGQAEAIGAIVAQLEAKRTELQIALAARRAFLVDGHPQIVELEEQIAAISDQIDEENARMAAPQGGRLNTKMEEFERLVAEATFAEELYRSALASLEQGRVESTRTIKKLSIIQEPSLPQDPELPERLRKAIIFTLISFLIAGIAQLLTMIIKDHRD